MWARVCLIAVCAIYASGDPANQNHRTLEVGETLEASIQTFPAQQFTCFLETPAKEIIELHFDREAEPSKYEVHSPNLMIGCAVSVKITGPEDNGPWRLFFEAHDGNPDDEIVYVVSVAGIDVGAENDEPTPEDTEVEIEYQEKKIFHTKIGATHKITITKYDFVETKDCSIVTPNAIEYKSVDQNIPGIKWIEDENTDCGVEITVDGEDMVGIWTLYSGAIRHSQPIERRLPFAIYVEEYVKATPEEVTIAMGNDLHVRLVDPPPLELRDSCRITGPNEEYVRSYKLDEKHLDTCGFIVTGIQAKDNGTWSIVYGTKIVYRAPVEVTVTGDMELTNESLKWITGQPVDVLVGPENAVYCRVTDSAFRVASENFGRCHITLDAATRHHNGYWQLTVGLPGRITTDIHWVQVVVLDAEKPPQVITHVEKQQPDIILGCALPIGHEVKTCKFRDPAGRILLAAEGVGEDRYSFHHGVNKSLATNMDVTSCGLKIRNPTTQDLGLWRCAMETADDVHYGFLRVLCPWALQDENVAAAVITEPTLKPYESSLWGPEGAMSLRCAIQAPIKYCYFRASNGTVYNVDNGVSNDVLQYVGDGFAAGDCGMRINLNHEDSGTWSCHVGLDERVGDLAVDSPEQRAPISVYVDRIFSVEQLAGQGSSLSLFGRVFEGRALDYCRYVRIDGLGFTEDMVPDRYVVFSDLHHGVCALHIPSGSILDHHPWTIAARIRGQNVEVSATTNATLVMPPTPPPGPPPSFFAARFFTLIILLSLTFGFMAIVLTSKKSRNWTSKKAVALRNSFRRNRPSSANNTSTTTTNNTPPPAYTA